MALFSNIFSLLTPSQRRNTVGLMVLMVIGMFWEMLGIGMVIPTITLTMQTDLAEQYPFADQILRSFKLLRQTDMIAAAMAVLVGIYLVKNFYLSFLVWRQTHFSYMVQAQLSQRLFTIYMRQPYTFHLQRNSAELIRNITGEVTMFTYALQSSLAILSESLVLLGLVTILLVVEPIGALVVMGALGGCAWLFYYYTRSLSLRWGNARQVHDGLRVQHLQQGLGGAKDVKLLGREDDFLSRYQLHNTQSARAGEIQATLQQLPKLWLELFSVLGLALLVFSLSAQGAGVERIVPALGVFSAAAFRLMPSVNRILNAAQALRYNLPVIRTLRNELALAVSETKPHSIRLRNSFQKDLCLDHVCFRYPAADRLALDDISLTIARGQSIGFMGKSGSGKSTLVDVILGLLTPDTGKVKADGRDIQEDLRNWQDQIGYVPQHIYLTDDTLKRNVAFGLADNEIDEAAVKQALELAQLDEFVKSLPDGSDTLVGERGIRLSGGQRQRIGIARALYHNPSVLVLDEATSALDTHTEAEVMRAVNALQGSKTIIIVAHRLSTIESCKYLYRLEGGKIVASGTPEKLLGKAGSHQVELVVPVASVC